MVSTDYLAALNLLATLVHFNSDSYGLLHYDFLSLSFYIIISTILIVFMLFEYKFYLTQSF